MSILVNMGVNLFLIQWVCKHDNDLSPYKYIYHQYVKGQIFLCM